jgi:hypothetical protein
MAVTLNVVFLPWQAFYTLAEINGLRAWQKVSITAISIYSVLAMDFATL